MNHLAALRTCERLRVASNSHMDAVGCCGGGGVRNILLAERRNKIARLLVMFQHPGRCSTYLDLLMIHSGALER